MQLIHLELSPSPLMLIPVAYPLASFLTASKWRWPSRLCHVRRSSVLSVHCRFWLWLRSWLRFWLQFWVALYAVLNIVLSTKDGPKSLDTFLIGNTGYRSLGTSKNLSTHQFTENIKVYTHLSRVIHILLFIKLGALVKFLKCQDFVNLYSRLGRYQDFWVCPLYFTFQLIK